MIRPSVYVKKSKVLTEAFESVATLKSQLNSDMIAVMNASTGSENWANSNKWSDASNKATSVKEQEALAEIFIETSASDWGCSLSQLEPGKDILVSLITQLGFESTDNPYLSFMPTFFKGSGKGITISEDSWIILNDAYATGVLDPADLMGTGQDKNKHLIFNPNFYSLEENSDNFNILKTYSYLSEPSNVTSMNLDAIRSLKAEGKPESYNTLTNSMAKSSTNNVRNIIIFVDSKNPLGKINKYYWIKLAVNTATTTQYTDKEVRGYPGKLKNVTITTKSGTERVKTVTQFFYDDKLKNEIPPQASKIYVDINDEDNRYVWMTKYNCYIKTNAKDEGTSPSANTKNKAYQMMTSLSQEDREKVIRELIKNGLIKTK